MNGGPGEADGERLCSGTPATTIGWKDVEIRCY
jgi:hypothetical protein